MTLRQRPEGHSVIFSFDSLSSDSEYKIKKQEVHEPQSVSFGTLPLSARLSIRPGASFSGVSRPVGYPVREGITFSGMPRSVGYPVRQGVPIRGRLRYGRSCGRLAAATDWPMRRKRSSGSSTSSGSWGYSSASTRRQVSAIHSPPTPEATRPSTITWRRE